MIAIELIGTWKMKKLGGHKDLEHVEDLDWVEENWNETFRPGMSRHEILARSKELLELASRVAVMYAGRIVENTKATDLIRLEGSGIRVWMLFPRRLIF